MSGFAIFFFFVSIHYLFIDLKVVFAVGLLFVLFLWSGGIWHYNPNEINIRYNKITGTMQYFSSSKTEQ